MRDAFRYYEGANRGTFSACIQYDEGRAHRIYAGADVVLVPAVLSPAGSPSSTPCTTAPCP